LRDLAAAYYAYSEYFAGLVGRWCCHCVVDLREELAS
jgi:hypothetical protein